MKDLGLLLLRIAAGTTLVAHGYAKLFGGEGKSAPDMLTRVFGPEFPNTVQQGGPEAIGGHFEQMGIPLPHLGAYLSGTAEFGGGLALLTGTMTRWAALAVAINLAVAIQKVHWKNGMVGQGGFEYPAQLFAEAATLFVSGPGAFSIDGIFGGLKAGGRAVSRGGENVGQAAAKARKRGSKALESVTSQAQSLPLPF